MTMSTKTTLIMPRKEISPLARKSQLMADLAILSGKNVLSLDRRKEVVEALNRCNPSWAVDFKMEMETIESNVAAGPGGRFAVGRQADVRIPVLTINRARNWLVQQIEQADKAIVAKSAQAAS